MKYTKTITALLMASTLCACYEVDRSHEKTIPESGNYDNNFAIKYSGCGMSAIFNYADTYELNFQPSSRHEVKIYALQNSVYHLVARYHKVRQPKKMIFDAPILSDHFVVDVDGLLYRVEANGKLSMPAAVPNASGAKISDVPLGWILAIENEFDAVNVARYGRNDFDFNDLVIHLTSVVEDDHVNLCLTPKACGDAQQFFLHLKLNGVDELLWPEEDIKITDAEFHQWFGVKDYMTRINTGRLYSDGKEVVHNPNGGWASIDVLDYEISRCNITVEDEFWTLSDFSYTIFDSDGRITDCNGLYVTVGSAKSINRLRMDRTVGVISVDADNGAPRMLLIPDEGFTDSQWLWPREGIDIGSVYGSFLDWVAGLGAISYFDWYKTYPAILKDVYYPIVTKAE